MNAQNLAFAVKSTEPTQQSDAMTTEAYLVWLGGINFNLTALQADCSAKFSAMQNEPGQGGSRGPWLNAVNQSLIALLQGAMDGAIDAANAE